MREVSLKTLPNVNIRDPSHDNLPIMSVTGSINQDVFKLEIKVLKIYSKYQVEKKERKKDIQEKKKKRIHYNTKLRSNVKIMKILLNIKLID